MTCGTKCRLPQIGWENCTTVPLFPNWHMAWPEFLPRDKRKEGTTCAREQGREEKKKKPKGKKNAGEALKLSTFDRSVAWLEHGTWVASARSNLVRSTLLLLKPANLHFTANSAASWMPLHIVCRLWTASRAKKTITKKQKKSQCTHADIRFLRIA